MQIKINDLSFYPDKSSSKYYSPKYFEWYRGIEDTSKDNNIIFYTDMCFNMVKFAPKHTFKMAFIIEPRSICPNIYEWIKDNYHAFDMVITHDISLLTIDNRFKYVPFGGCWIKEENFGLHNKTKNISIIASSKNYTIGHNLRHQVIDRYKNVIDVFGGGYQPIKEKIDGLKDYRFHFVIENAEINDYWTEKQNDALVCGCIPLYFGTTNIGKYFNIKGMILFNSLNDLNYIIKDISNDGQKIYESKLPYIKENFELAQNYICCEDLIYKNILIPNKLV